MDEKTIDLSSLAPRPDRWDSVLESTKLGIESVMLERDRARDDALVTIAGWSRPLLFAAAAALAILIPVEVALERHEARVGAARRLASVSVTWLASDEAPSGAEILRVIAEGGTR